MTSFFFDALAVVLMQFVFFGEFAATVDLLKLFWRIRKERCNHALIQINNITVNRMKISQ